VTEVDLDGTRRDAAVPIPLADDGKAHVIRIVMGPA